MEYKVGDRLEDSLTGKVCAVTGRRQQLADDDCFVLNDSTYKTKEELDKDFVKVTPINEAD